MVKIATILLLVCVQAFACTGMRMTAQDGSSANGRTVEFGIPIQMTAAVIPRGYSFTGQAPNGPGLKYTAKYAAVGIYCFGDPVLMDGVNEKGLTAAAFYFPGFASYSEITAENQGKALSPEEFPNWILTQFATLDEVKAGLENVVIAPTILKAWGPEAAPFHYIVYDKAGNALVIEPLGGKLVTYENKIGAFTNSPTFDWHMTNLRNYIHLSPVDAGPVTIRGVELASFGLGSGLAGLPGDFSPPSRFVRATIFSSSALPVKTGAELPNQLFHLLNQFDIPVGAVRQSGETDSTLLTSVKDPNTLTYYYRSYANQNILSVELGKYNLNAKEIVSIEIDAETKSVNHK